MDKQLQNLLERLSSIPDVPGITEIIEKLKQDLSAFNTGFHVALVAFNRKSLDSLESSVKSVFDTKEIMKLPPYSTATNWSPADYRIIERARVLILTTTAKKLIPGSLLEIIEISNTLEIPSIYLVEGMGRMRNPQEFSGKVMAEISKIHKPALVTCHLMSDDRYSGMEMPEMVKYLSKKELDDRDRLIRRRTSFLTHTRAYEALTRLENQESSLVAKRREISGGKQLLRAGINKSEVNVRLAKENLRSELLRTLTYFEEIEYTVILKELNLDSKLLETTATKISDEEEQKKKSREKKNDAKANSPDGEPRKDVNVDTEEILDRIAKLLVQAVKIIKGEADTYATAFKDGLEDIKNNLIQDLGQQYTLEVRDLERFDSIDAKKIPNKVSSSNIDKAFKQIETEFSTAIALLEQLPSLQFQDRTLMELYLKLRSKIGEELANPEKGEGKENNSKSNEEDRNKSQSHSEQGNSTEEGTASGIDFSDLIRQYGDQYFIEKTIGDLLRQIVAATCEHLQNLNSQLDIHFDSDLALPAFIPLLDAYEKLYGSVTTKQDAIREKIGKVRDFIDPPMSK